MKKAYIITIAMICLVLAAIQYAAPANAQSAGLFVYLPMISKPPAAVLGNCPVFPENNIWNTPVDALPVHSNSGAYIHSIGTDARAHADFGSGEWPPGSGAAIGIPYRLAPGTQPKVAIHFTAYGDESDPGPYPIPADAQVEGSPQESGDRHVLIVDEGDCTLYELFRAFRNPDGSWNADSGAVFDLRSNGPLRPAGWTSADAAGLPILPGLVRYDEVAAGEIRHALRFTAQDTQDAYVWPARHEAGSSNASYPPMGQRFRLKASFDISGAPGEVQVMLRAMKKYGIILADNGSAWYISGAPDSRWNNDALHWLDSHLSGAAFEAVDAASLMIDPNSGQARQP